MSLTQGMARVHGELDLADALFTVADLLGGQMQTALAARGLTVTQGALLWHLAREGPVIQRALSEHLGVAARTVTGLVDDLVSTGQVERSPSPNDRRAWLVGLTPAGERAVRRMRSERAAFATSMCESLSDRDVVAASRVLRQIDSHLRDVVANGGGR